MNRAKSTRRVRLLARMGSPTCRLHTGRPWLSPSSRSLPRTRVQRVSLANTRRQAYLVVEVGEASDAPGPAAELHERFEPPRVNVLAVEADVPPRREHEAGARTRVVENSLRRSRRVSVDAPRHEYYQHSVAFRYCFLDDLRVVRRSWDERDASFEPLELAHALLPADADHLVAPIKRVLDHVLPELPGRADDADPHRGQTTPRRQLRPQATFPHTRACRGALPRLPRLANPTFPRRLRDRPST